MHPLVNSTISVAAVFFIKELSMPALPNSLTTTIVPDRSWENFRICLTRVVFPAPRNPVTI